MAIPARKLTQNDWESHKAEIQNLYIFQDLSLNSLIEKMTERSFEATKQQYRAHFNTWGFEKYMSEKQRKFVDRKLSKRDKENKQTRILKRGVVLPMNYIRRQLKRHCVPTLSSKFSQRSPSPQTSDNEWGLKFRTPSPSPAPQSVCSPWLCFQRTVLRPFINNFKMPVFTPEIASRIVDAFEPYQELRDVTSSMTMASVLPKIQSGLGRFLLDSHMEVQTTTPNTIGKRETQGKSLLLEAMFYGITNHHIRSYDGNQNQIIASLLNKSIFAESFLAELRKSDLYSSEVLLDSLFSASIRLRNVAAVELFLRTGADPCKRLLFPEFKDILSHNGILPIEAAILCKSLDVADCLHRNGAKIPKTKKEIYACGWRRSPIEMLNHWSYLSTEMTDYFTLHYTATLGELAELLRYHAEDHDAMLVLNLLQRNPANAKPEVVLSALLVLNRFDQTGFTDEPSTPAIVPKLRYSSTVCDSVLQLKTLRIIEKMEEHGANVNHSAIDGVPSLHLATQLGLSHVVKGLLALGSKTCLNIATPDGTKARFQGTPLHIALRAKNTGIASLLIKAGATVDGFSVHAALSLGMEEDLKQCTSFDRRSVKPLTPVSAAFLHGSPTFPYQQLMEYPDEYDAALLLAMVYSSTTNREFDISLIRTLLERRQFTRNTLSFYEGSALAIAAREGDEIMTKLLLDFGIGPDSAKFCFKCPITLPGDMPDYLGLRTYKEYTVSECAAETLTTVANGEYSSTLKILLDNGFFPSRDTVGAAFFSYDATMAHVLTQYLISSIPSTHQEKMLQVCLDLCLIYACESRGYMIREILLTKVDLNATVHGVTALATAVTLENEDTVKLLLRHGADVNHPSVLRGILSTAVLEVLIAHQASGRKTWALVAAVKLGSVDFVEKLLSSGVDINSHVVMMGDEEDVEYDTAATPLQVAAMHGYNRIAKLLLNRGADPNSRSIGHNGRTALEGAAENGRLDMVSLLLRSKTLTEGQGQRQYLRAVRFATEECHPAVERLLRDHRKWTDDDELRFSREDLLKCVGVCSECYGSAYGDRDTGSDNTDGTDRMDDTDDIDMDDVGDVDCTNGMVDQDGHGSPGIANIEDTEMDMGPIQIPSGEPLLLEPTELGVADGTLTISNYDPLDQNSQVAPTSWENFWLDFDAYFDFDAYNEDAGPNLGGFVSPEE